MHAASIRGFPVVDKLLLCYGEGIMAHYFVTGGAGYIGSHVVKALLDAGHRVRVFDDLSTGNRANVDERAEFVGGSILDRVALASAMEGVDGVMHLAAKLLVEESVQQPVAYYETNVVGSLNVVQAMQQTGVKKVVFSSTAAVYDEHAAQPLTEDAPTRPVNPYGWSKLMTEQMLLDAQVEGIEPSILRYFNVAGKEEWFTADYSHETHLIPLMIEVVEGRRDVLSVFGTDYDTRDGSCIRDYIHVSDIASAHVAALTQNVTGVLNVGSGDGVSVLEMLKAARSALGHDIPAHMEERRPGDAPVLIADTSRIREQLNWKPTHSVEEMLVSAQRQK